MFKITSICLHARPEALAQLGNSIVDNPPIHSRVHTRLRIFHIMASEQSRFESGRLGYTVWSIMQEQVYQTPIHDVNDLKQRLLYMWATRSASGNHRLFCQSKFWQIKFKHSYLFIYWAKRYGVLDSSSSLNSLTIWKVLEWYDQE